MKRMASWFLVLALTVAAGGSASAGTGYVSIEAYVPGLDITLDGVTHGSALDAGTGSANITTWAPGPYQDVNLELTCLAVDLDSAPGSATIRAEGIDPFTGDYYLIEIAGDEQTAVGTFGYTKTELRPQLCSGWDIEMIGGETAIFRFIWV